MAVKKKSKKKNGRPTAYRKYFDMQAYNYCKLGATDDNLAEFFGVTYVTVNKWKKIHSGFITSIRDGKREYDDKIEKSLSQRALGYSHIEEKIFNNQGEIIRAETTKHYPPDTAACIFWLKNRKPEKWREKQEIKHDVKEGSGVMMVPNIASMSDWNKMVEENEKDLKEKEKVFSDNV